MNVKIANKYLKHIYPFLFVALNYHKTHRNEKMSFIDMHYLIDIYKDNSSTIAVKKSTQSGISEYLIVRAITTMMYERRNIFYVLPTDRLKNQFVNTRFDQSVSFSEFYRDLFKNADYDNMSVKQVGSASLFFAVSYSRSNFTSFPADDLIIDEINECDFTNIAMADERLAFCKNPRKIYVSNPTYYSDPIDELYNLSDQKIWIVKCEHCNHEIDFDFFKHVIKKVSDTDYVIVDTTYDTDSDRDINIMCDKCNRPIYRYAKGFWKQLKPNIKHFSGYALNQLFTSRVPIRELVNKFSLAQFNPTKLQRFYNGCLGIAFEGEDTKITEEMINCCVRDYKMPYTCKDVCVLGMDINVAIHTVIFNIQLTDNGYIMKLVFAGELKFNASQKTIDISELKNLYARYNIVAGLVDSRPESRFAKMLSFNFKNLWRCDYLTESIKDSVDKNQKVCKVDRTSSMDNVRESLVLQKINFPVNIKYVEGFCDQLKAPLRIYEEKEGANGRWVWREGGKADHYYHAINYASIAKNILLKQYA